MNRTVDILMPHSSQIWAFGKLLLSSSGLKDWVISRDTPSCARSERDTVCLKGQGRRGSNSLFMRAMKKDRCVQDLSQSSVTINGLWRGENDDEAEYDLGQDHSHLQRSIPAQQTMERCGSVVVGFL